MRAQDLPVKLIVIAGLGILTFIVGTAMFVIGMRGASQQTRLVNLSQADCQGVCASISVAANNYADCSLLKSIPSAVDYSSKCSGFGPCRVSLSNDSECAIP